MGQRARGLRERRAGGDQRPSVISEPAVNPVTGANARRAARPGAREYRWMQTQFRHRIAARPYAAREPVVRQGSGAAA